MVSFRVIATFLGVFGAGVVTAAFFLSGPVDEPIQTPTPSVPAAVSSMPKASDPVPPLGRRSVRTIPIERSSGSSPETTGQAVGPPDPRRGVGADESQAGHLSSCNVEACSRTYRSFDNATCTYQPYSGGPRQLCEK